MLKLAGPEEKEEMFQMWAKLGRTVGSEAGTGKPTHKNYKTL